jgi:hypothetical protein
MAGLDAAIHDLLRATKTWTPGTSPGMASGEKIERPGAIPAFFFSIEHDPEKCEAVFPATNEKRLRGDHAQTTT